MRNKVFCLAKFFAVAAFVVVALIANRSFASERPNIIFILTDDMGYGDVGCYGGKFVPTPNIDRLAKEGTRFTQYYCAAPVCSPSRAGFLTGSFPARWQITTFLHHHKGNRACEQADFLDAKAPSIARTMKQSGYATAHIGKWHVGGGRDVTNAPPFSAYGFDEHVSTWESPDPDPNLTATNWIWSFEDNVQRWDRTGYFVDKTLDFLSRHKGQPCYVNLWPDDVHTPWVPEGTLPKRERSEETSRTSFERVLAEYDRQMGRLLDGLKKLGLDEKTIVVFSSDNGPAPSLDGVRAGGLRGTKLSLYEGGIRMPFIVRWPSHTPAGQVDEKSVLHAVDLFPTFCAFAEATLPKGVKLDGENMSAAFLGKSATHSAPLFWEYGRNTNAFGFPQGRDRSPNLAVREGNWKFLINADGSDGELYDLSADRNETTNVAEKNPQVAARLKKNLFDWQKSWPKISTTKNP